MLTTRDFIGLAKVLHRAKPDDSHESSDEYLAALATWNHCVTNVAAYCEAANSSFNRELFLTRCGVSTPER